MLSSRCNDTRFNNNPCYFLTAVKHLIQKVLEQLMGKGVSVDEEQEDDTAVLHRTQCTISALCQWYKTAAKVGEDEKINYA